jgi:hypothetical protein
MRAAFSFAARRPGHEVHREQGQNKNCPFSLWASWKWRCSSSCPPTRIMFLECVCHCFDEKWAQLCDARFQPRVVAKSIQIPSNSCAVNSAEEANSRKERGKINGNYALCKTLKVHDSGQLYYACSRAGSAAAGIIWKLHHTFNLAAITQREDIFLLHLLHYKSQKLVGATLNI